MTAPAAPLLRSPPFPWVDAAIAAVSQAGRGDGDPARLAALVAAVREARVGGSFWAPPAMPRDDAPIVIRAGSEAGLAAARAHAATLLPGAPVVACLPDAPWGRARTGDVVIGEVDPWSLLRPGVTLIADPDDEWRAIAAIAGASVDGPVDLSAWLLGQVAYRDPFSGQAASAEQAVVILADWRRVIDANRRIAATTGIAWWKKQAIEHFLWAGRPAPLASGDDAVTVVRTAGAAGGAVATWPSRAPAGLREQAIAAAVPVVQIEDGFIRSVGLGSALHVPRSIVVDRRGIYYDPRRPSDLEALLATADFPPNLVARAAALRERIVAQGISKYASDAKATAAPPTPRTKRTVLVAGQVEDDMSVRAGGGGVRGNRDLIARARAAEPDAHLIFKPHPDVDAGHRTGRIPDADLAGVVDEIVRGESMAALLARVDAVHVLTSQTGFEALLRGVETHVHGQPFYAGWGLTRDLARPIARRGRQLMLDELVAATLILYPRYLDPETELPCPPEILIDRFARQQRPRRTLLILARQFQGRIARAFGRVTD